MTSPDRLGAIDAAAVSSHNLPSPDINESEPVNVSSHTVDPTAADKKKPRWTKAALSLMMISLDVLKEVPFPPVKAAAGILIIFVKNCEVRCACFAKHFAPLIFEQANDGEPQDNRIVNRTSSRSAKITQ